MKSPFSKKKWGSADACPIGIPSDRTIKGRVRVLCGMMQIECAQRVTWTGVVGSLHGEAGPVPFLVRRRVHAIGSQSALFLTVKTKQECKDTFCNFLPIGNRLCFFACFPLYLCKITIFVW